MLEDKEATCSGEFGNPSGHSLNTSFWLFTCLHFYKHTYKDWFERNKCMGILIEIFCWVWNAITCLCRLYLGRHSVDQLLVGLMIGIFHCVFCLRIIRPYFYDPIFFPKKIEGEKNMVKAVERSRTAAGYACLYYFLLSVKIIVLYENIERNNLIPQKWWDAILSTCPNFLIKHTFHNFSMFHLGYIITVPLSYLTNYWSKRRVLRTGEM